MRLAWRTLALVSAAVLMLPQPLVEADQAPDPAGVEFFERRIRPLLAEHCHQCHGAAKQESGLALASGPAIRKGGDRGPPLEPGDPDKSLLIRAVRYSDEDLKMPPRGKLKDEQIADLVTWIRLGAPLPADADVPTSPAAPLSAFDVEERRKHWSYQPVVARPLPDVHDPGWCLAPVDRFILARLGAAGLGPAPPADRRTLIRRLTFDLTGLPPTPDEVAAFLADEAPDACERLVDRLLASPRYGERWARHWLDVVRYCETLGFEFDYDLHNAWRYRDYVIRALNDDLPYDQFVVEHLAGDLVPAPRRHPRDGTNESILATGFFWMLEGKQTPVDIRQDQADRIENQIDVMGKAFLGQTIACARCHDHKFDAVGTRDYYALAGYLRSSRYQQAFLDPPELMRAQRQELAVLREKIDLPLRKLLAETWKAELAKAADYLLAARQVKTETGGKSNAAALAQQTGLEAARLEQWAQAVAHESLAAADHPLFAWRQAAPPAGLEEKASEAAVPAGIAATQATQFADFRRGDFHDWIATGDAFGQPGAGIGQLVLGVTAERPVARLTAGGADSGRWSDRLQGELRSPSFTISQRFVHLRLSGKNSRVNLVIDGYTLIMNPMYGKLTAGPTSNVPAWRTMPVARWLGQRAYLEVSDSSIPLHVLNPPPSTARTADGPDGHIVLDEVVFSDDPQPPVKALTNKALTNKALTSGQGALVLGSDTALGSLAAAYASLMQEAVQRFGEAQLDAGDESQIALLNWLLENGLLDTPLKIDDRALAGLLRQHRELSAALPLPQRAPALADGTGEDEFIFLRGNYRAPGERAQRGPPQVLVALLDAPPASPPAGSGRLELARQLAGAANPLLTRSITNRLWQHHFGSGLVPTPDDFGRMGQPPSHPELLDFLAAELVHANWSLKSLHRRIVTSATYRQSSSSQNLKSQIQNHPDPNNRFLGHYPRRRLEAEAIRDSLLALSGRLTGELHGPSVLPHLTSHMEGRGRPQSGPLDGDGRRSIYLNARRNFLTPLLLAFDYPVTFTPIGRRGNSAIPAQSLALMNDPFIVQEAARWADRALAEPHAAIDVRIADLYQAAFSRPPTADEIEAAIDFLQQQSARYAAGTGDPRAWADLCHVLINTKEFIFVE
jgi:hypothetical protein